MSFLYYLCYALMLASTFLGLWLLLTKRLDEKMRPIVWAVTVSIIEDLLSHYCSVKYKNNLAVLYLFNPIEYACYAWFFYINIDYKLFKQLIKYSVVSMFVVTYSYFYFFITAPVYQASAVLSYVIVTKALFLIFWPIAYLKNSFDRVDRYKKLNVYLLIVVGGILFYAAFSAIFRLSSIYLINYSIKHQVGIYDILKTANVARMYASKQLKSLNYLLYFTNILSYICILIAFINNAIISKNRLKTSV